MERRLLIFDGESLKHSKWECKYHLMFIPKYRKEVLYGALRHQLADLLRELARQCESQIEENHLLRDHVHMLVLIPLKYSVAQVVGW
jgi:putative transposase